MYPSLLHDPVSASWLAFSRPVAILRTHAVGEVQPILRELAQRVDGEGLWAVGFLSYEAAPAFDAALTVHPPPQGRALPLLEFALYPPPERLASNALASALPTAPFQLGAVQPSVDRAAYLDAIARIHRHIEAGDTYQVNYTLRLEAPFEGDPRGLFREMTGAQDPPYGAYLEVAGGEQVLCSASPELFFRLDGGQLTCRPMKGTAGRGRTLAEDEAQSAWLAASAKNRAENVMIVDMVRNDLGRIARPGSVAVPALFQVDRHPSVWQMTSTVTAQARAAVGFPEVLAALFPCASITGAPKARTMEIITALETAPRGIYTGAMGFLAPGGLAQMNVAIRTVAVDRPAGRALYGVGGGIVWDSVAEEEYQECRIKALALPRRDPRSGRSRRPPRDFDLLETILWEPDEGFFLLDRHLARLRDSAVYFAFPFHKDRLRQALDGAAARLPATPHRLRLLIDRRGQPRVEAFPLEAATDADTLPVTVHLAAEPVDATDPFLFHKTTHRQIYEEALQKLAPLPGGSTGSRPQTEPKGTATGAPLGKPSDRAQEATTQDDPGSARAESRREPNATQEEKLAPLPGGSTGSRPPAEVLLWNAAGEVTEATTANIVVLRDGRRITPPVECGLLAGTFRGWLLERGEIEEGVVRLEDLPHCDAIWLINSVRRWRRAALQNAMPTETCSTKLDSR